MHVCGLFEFRQIFLLWELVYIFQSLCRSLQNEMSSGFNSLVQYILTGKEERNSVVIHW